MRLSWSKLIFLLCFLIGANFGVGDRSLCLFSSLNAETPTELEMCSPCACSHSLWEFIYVSVLLCLKDTVSLMSFILSGSYNLPVSSSVDFSKCPEGDGFEDIPLNTELPGSLFLCTRTEKFQRVGIRENKDII